MTIHSGSRYRNVSKNQVDLGDGETVAVYEIRPTTVFPPEGTEAYVIKAGDTLESLAHEWFGSANKWYVLADFNPQIFWPLDLRVGDRIIRPTKEYAAQI